MNSPVTENDVDQLLTRFFRRETPARWPDAPLGPTVTRATSSWTLTAGRMLVGGSLIATVAIYAMLSGFFASEQKAGLNPNGQPTIGQRPKMPTPNVMPPIKP
jgi:hypothetical protein